MRLSDELRQAGQYLNVPRYDLEAEPFRQSDLTPGSLQLRANRKRHYHLLYDENFYD